MNYGGPLLVAGAVLAACTTAQPPTVKPQGSASSSAALSSPIDAATAADASREPVEATWLTWPTTWTDPRVVDALAEKCDYVPEKPLPKNVLGLRPSPVSGSVPADVFHCKLGHDQSCVANVCPYISGKCEGDCVDGCTSCGGDCSKGCETCKSGCKDDASCKHQCAETCAKCKQDCNEKLDHCSYADCGKKREVCEKKVFALWKAGGCKAKCTRYEACTSHCSDSNDISKCRDGCSNQLSPGWNACNAKCSALSEAGKYDEAQACAGECFLKVPCAPDICDTGGGGP